MFKLLKKDEIKIEIIEDNKELRKILSQSREKIEDILIDLETSLQKQGFINLDTVIETHRDDILSDIDMLFEDLSLICFPSNLENIDLNKVASILNKNKDENDDDDFEIYTSYMGNRRLTRVTTFAKVLGKKKTIKGKKPE